MREPNLPPERDIGGAVGAALALAHGQRSPLADAVCGQDRRAPGGRGEKRRSGV